MACTTILVGKKASYDGSTMIARNDDSPSGVFHVKKMVIVNPEDQKNPYKSVISHVSVDLPKNPLRYTLMPNVDLKEGLWGAAGINSENVGMTATETITTNPRVMGADPYVVYKKEGEEETIGGIGEEDLVVLVLPYIHSAREGVVRLGELLEKYGTYEPNGIAFNDENEIWWLESIGGHHFIAKKVPDDKVVIMPNQFGLDEFDFEDACTEQKENICSKDLKEFMIKNHLNVGTKKLFNPREAFGSHTDSDHVYNTPRAWFMGRYFNPITIKWDGENAQYSPLSDDIPWSLVPEKLVTIEDVKYVLSSHFQGTKYDPYQNHGETEWKGAYRPIGVNRTAFLALLQIRPNMKKELAAIEWVAFGSNTFNAFVPLFSNVSKVPEYFNNTTLTVSTDNFYWASRLLGALADPHFQMNVANIERYQESVANKAHRLLDEAEASKDFDPIKVNETMAKMAKEETDKALNNVLFVTSMLMKNSYAKSDN